MTTPAQSTQFKTPFKDAEGWITLFADASFCPETKAYGWCFWIKHGSPAKTIVRSGGGASIQSSLEAEVEALRQGLLEVSKLAFTGKRIVAQSDCTGALARITPDLYKLRAAGAYYAYTKHVKGHRGNRDPRASVNTKCDYLAGVEIRKYRAQAASIVRPAKTRKP